MYNRILSAIIITLASSVSIANTNALEPKQLVWPFDGIFGSFDRQAAQRGLKVYLEVCSTCHSMNHIYYRNLKDLGFSEAEIKQLAKNYNVTDGPNSDGEMFQRPATPSDRFVSPYPNEEAARAANNGALPIDLSLIVKARHDGANYIFSILTGYSQAPEGFEMLNGLNYNPYFEGKKIAMPAPLVAGQVEFIDGTPATLEQMAKDVTIFLQWSAEPEMEHRKSMGLKVMLFLIGFTIFFYIVKRKIWRKISH